MAVDRMDIKALLRRETGFIVLIISALYFGGGAMVPSGDFKVESGCDLRREACVARSGAGSSIELSIAPNGIPLLQPLDVSVVLRGISGASVEVAFTGVDVGMGRLVYPMRSEDGVLYVGTASLSVCTQRKMRWQAEVRVDTPGQSYTVPFQFETEYRSKFLLI